MAWRCWLWDKQEARGSQKSCSVCAAWRWSGSLHGLRVKAQDQRARGGGCAESSVEQSADQQWHYGTSMLLSSQFRSRSQNKAGFAQNLILTSRLLMQIKKEKKKKNSDKFTTVLSQRERHLFCSHTSQKQ